MSQEKVNRYKEEKAHRKEILAKEKRHKTYMKIGGGVIALALVCWLGYSVYDMATRPILLRSQLTRRLWTSI